MTESSEEDLTPGGSEGDREASPEIVEELETRFACPECGKPFETKSALRGHTRIHSVKSKGADTEIQTLREEVERTKLEKERLKNELESLKSKRELDTLRTPSIDDPIEIHLQRILRLREMELMGAGGDAPASTRDGDRIARLEARLERQEEENRRLEHERDLEARLEAKYAKPADQVVEMDIPSGSFDQNNRPVMQHVAGIPVSMIPGLIAQGRAAIEASQKHETTNTNAVVAAIEGLSSVVERTQSNAGSALKAMVQFLTAGGLPQRPPAAAIVQGVTPNPNLEILKAYGLIDSPDLPSKPKPSLSGGVQ